MMFTSDGARILSWSVGGIVRVWDSTTGVLIYNLNADGGIPIRLSPDCTQILTSSDRTLRILDATTGTLMCDLTTNHMGEITRGVWSPDGAKIASGSRDCTLRVWETTTGHSIGKPLIGHNSAITSIEFSSNGTRIVSASHDHTVCIWDAATGAMIIGPLHGHDSSVVSVVWSPCDTQIVSRSANNTVRIWDATSGVLIGEPIGGNTDEVSFSPDGKHIMVYSTHYLFDYRHIWDLATGSLTAKLSAPPGTYIFDSAFSPDGTRVVTGCGDGMIRIFASTGALIGQPFSGHTETVSEVKWSHDGKRIVSSSNDRTLRIWDSTMDTSFDEPPADHASTITHVEFSDDGGRLISSSDDGTILVWDTTTGAVIGELPGGHGGVQQVLWSPDGSRMILAFQRDTSRLWDSFTFSLIGELNPNDRSFGTSVDWITFSEDGTRIVCGFRFSDVFCVWDSTTGVMIAQCLTPNRSEIARRFSPDGVWAVFAYSNGKHRIWDIDRGLPTGKLLAGPAGIREFSLEEYSEDPFSSECRLIVDNLNLIETKPIVVSALVEFSPDATRVVCSYGDCTLCIWDMATGVMAGKPLTGHTATIESVAFTPNGACILSWSHDGTIRMWDSCTGCLVGAPFMSHRLIVPPNAFTVPISMALSPDQAQLVSVSLIDPCMLRIWDSVTGASLGRQLAGHTKQITQVIWLPDGNRIVSSSNDGTLRLWDSTTAALIGKPLMGHTKPITSMALSPDGTKIVSGAHDCTLRVWNSTTGAAIGEPLVGHTSYITFVDFLPIGSRIVSGSFDSTLRLWDPIMGTAISEPLICHHSPIRSVAFSPDSKTMVSIGEEGEMYHWDVDTQKSLLGEMLPANSTSGSRRNELPLSIWRDGWVVGPGDQKLWWMPPSKRDGDYYIRVYSASNGRLAVGGGSRRLTLVDATAIVDRVYKGAHKGELELV